MDSSQWVAFLSAGAASIAAVLAGINLWATGRREQLTWVRSALEASFVDFLTACYDHISAAREIANLRDGKRSHRTEDQWRLAAEEYHQTTMNCITRFRVLASDEMATTAITLHQHLDDAMDLLDLGDTSPFKDTRNQRQSQFDHDRDVFVSMARGFLNLKSRHNTRPQPN